MVFFAISETIKPQLDGCGFMDFLTIAN